MRQADLKFVAKNPKNSYLLCSSTSNKYPHRDFDIVDIDGKWDCRHKNCRYSRDIKNCGEPKLGYYEKERNSSDFILLPNGKYWDYTETNFNKKLKDLPDDKYYDGTQLQELPEMYFYDPLKGELQLIPYDDEKDKSK